MARPEQDPAPYQRASRFPGEQPAGQAYQEAQQVLYKAPESDLSVFRLQLNRLWYVAALGLIPPAPVLTAIEEALAPGEPVELPADVWHALAERRAQQIRHGPWTEAHHRPGKRL